MRIGLLSDIHANAHALVAVLTSAKRKNIEKLLCCGDYVGYYYEPDRVMKMMDDWDWVGIQGNHEVMLFDWMDGKNRDEVKSKYGSGISVAMEKLAVERLQALSQMPELVKFNINDKAVMLCHGSPWDSEMYVYPDSNSDTINRLFTHDPEFDLLVFGHTHHPVNWEQADRKIINPGSVGQPRDRKFGAAWAIWDSDTNDVMFCREEYDTKPVIEMCRQYDPEITYLVDVFGRT